jgi:hypothetical protein
MVFTAAGMYKLPTNVENYTRLYAAQSGVEAIILG